MLVVFGFELVFWHVDDGVIFFDFHQHLFAVESDLVIVRLAEHGFFAIVHVVSAKVRFLVFLAE